MAIAAALAAPAIGGLSTRYRQSTLIFWTLPPHVLATVALVLLVSLQAPAWVLFPRAATAATVVVAGGFLPLLAAGSVTTMGALITVAGIGLSPLLISANFLVGDMVPERSLTDGLAWLSSAIILGMVLGAGAGGALVDRFDSSASFTLGAAGAVLASLVAAFGLRTLRRNQLAAPQDP